MGKKNLFCAAFVMILLNGCSEFEWNPDSSSCGNRLIEIHEQCDDGNQVDEDGCSVQCQIEEGYECLLVGQQCTKLCGNGRRDPEEQCDDGNMANKDGCSKTCDIEEGYECLLVGQQCTELCGNGRRDPKEQCDDGNKGDGDGCSKTCDIEEGWYSYNDELCQIICGNGVMDPDEQCDDGNTNDNDGCSNECKFEDGWYLKDNTLYHMECGNGVLDPGEQCDDGDTDDDNGCTQACHVAVGWICPPTGPCFLKNSCGNGIVNHNEQCDDGNSTAADGCNECILEDGWYLDEDLILKPSICGNSIKEPNETCDDGNSNAKDGCNDKCHIEDGYECLNLGQPCTKLCGNNILDENEQCDDGNTADGDGCSTTCRVEEGWICSADGVCIKLPGHGNSQLDYGEECDDGNFNFGDGCTPDGKLEPFYTLVDGQAVPQCGDGLTIAPETCDDGNLNFGDGCSETCQIEENFDCTNGIITEEDVTTPYLPITIRDFRKQGSQTEGLFTAELVSQYPQNCNFKKDESLYDFYNPSCNDDSKNIASTLNANEKPYITEKTSCYACPESLEMWYQDVSPLNRRFEHTLYQTGQSYDRFVYDYTQQVGSKNTLIHSNENNYNLKISNSYFLPLGNAIFHENDIKRDGDNIGNFYFTVEAKGYFKYEPDTKIIVDADDSLWIFINGQLAMDLGGTHGVQGDITRIFSTDDDLTLTINHKEVIYKYNKEFNLIEGQYYPIHIFYAERGCCGSGLKLDTPLIYSPSICKPK